MDKNDIIFFTIYCIYIITVITIIIYIIYYIYKKISSNITSYSEHNNIKCELCDE